MGCHLEEVVEMLVELLPRNPENQEKLTKAISALTVLSDLMKSDGEAFEVIPECRLAVLDSLADQIVTATGVGVFLGMNVPGALDEVNRSNYSKFENGEPVFNENKKVMKGKDYTPPDLSKFI